MQLKPTISILCVDDERSILSSLKRAFRDDRFDVSIESDSQKALDTIKTKAFDVIISDMRMPTYDGAQLLAAAAKSQPGSVRILLSGFSDADALSRAVNDGRIHQFIHKPWNNKALLDVVEAEFARQTLKTQQKQFNRELSALSESMKAREEELEQQLSTQQIELTNAGYVIDMAEGRIEAALKNTYQMLSQITLARTGRSATFANNLVRHSIAVGRTMGLEKADLKALGMAASLCELGKIRFNDELARGKEQSFDDKAMRQYRLYPSIGADLLLPVDGLQPVSVILRQYREFVNGKGFPNKLLLNQITLSARILAIVYFFLDSIDDSRELDRLSVEKALVELSARSGTQFDEKVVSSYQHLIPELMDITQPQDDCITTFQLSNGQIVSRDLISDDGILLLSKGTELTDELIERLQIFEAQHKETLAINVWQHTSL